MALRIQVLFLLAALCPKLYGLDLCELVIAAPADVAVRQPLLERLNDDILQDRYSNVLSGLPFWAIQNEIAPDVVPLNGEGVLFVMEAVSQFALLRAGAQANDFNSLDNETRFRVIRKFAVDVTDTQSLILASEQEWFGVKPPSDSEQRYAFQQSTFAALPIDEKALNVWLETALRVAAQRRSGVQ